MRKSIESFIAKDFLQIFESVIQVSVYSPSAEVLATACRESYPSDEGFGYSVQACDIIEAAQQLKLPICELKGGEKGIGISAKAFHARAKRVVFSENLICKHGFSPYTIVPDLQSGLPVAKPICPCCVGGFEKPTPHEIRAASLWLINPNSKSAPTSGAIILAARLAGKKVTRGINGLFKIYGSKRRDLDSQDLAEQNNQKKAVG